MRRNNRLDTSTRKKNSGGKRPPIPITIQLKLWVRSGGRCEFYGCNENLLRDTLTLHETNYSNIAHLVSWSENGPRGKDPLPLPKRNEIENLMLVCTKHHKLIDSKEHINDYPKEMLLLYKQQHEERIERLTSCPPNCKTTIIRLKANVNDEAVEISESQIREAVFPYYPADLKGIEIDFARVLGANDHSYWKCKTKEITQIIEKLYITGIETGTVTHASVFALGPIPLLIHLGFCLSNKIPVDLYQRHRDSENWVWKQDGEAVQYKIKKRLSGSSDSVALILSLSGPIGIDDLPAKIAKEATIYEITLDGDTPNPMFLCRRAGLTEFIKIYQKFLGNLRRIHKNLKEIHLFPAVPAPVAVVIGRELMHKVSPALRIYDYNKTKGGFKFAIKVN